MIGGPPSTAGWSLIIYAVWSSVGSGGSEFQISLDECPHFIYLLIVRWSVRQRIEYGLPNTDR